MVSPENSGFLPNPLSTMRCKSPRCEIDNKSFVSREHIAKDSHADLVMRRVTEHGVAGSLKASGSGDTQLTPRPAVCLTPDKGSHRLILNLSIDVMS